MAWAPDYVTREAMKTYLEVTSTTHDDLIDEVISTASRNVDNTCSGAIERQFGIVDTPESREYTAYWSRLYCAWVVDVDDLADLTGLLIDVVGRPGVVTVTWEPVNAVKKGMVYDQMVISPDSAVQPSGRRNEVVITAKWGWPTIPKPVITATKLQAARYYTRRKAPFGTAGSPDGASSGGGNELRLLARVDPDFAVALKAARLVRRGAIG